MTADEFAEQQRRTAMAGLTPEKLERMVDYLRARRLFLQAPPKVGLFGSMYRAALGVKFEAEAHAAKVAGVQAAEARVLSQVLVEHFMGLYATAKFGDAKWAAQARAQCSQDYGEAVLALLTAKEAKFVAFVKEVHEAINAAATP